MKFLKTKIRDKRVFAITIATLVVVSFIILSIVITSSNISTKLTSTTKTTVTTAVTSTSGSSATSTGGSSFTTSTITDSTSSSPPASSTTEPTTTTTTTPPAPTWQQIKLQSSYFNALESTSSALAVDSISCPTTQTCYATYNGSLYVSHDTGVTWSFIGTGNTTVGVYGISCATNFNCIAHERTKSEDLEYFYTTNGGLSWTQSSLPSTATSFTQLWYSQCIVGSSTCIVNLSGNLGDVVLYSNNYGQSFSYASLPSSVSSTGNSFTNITPRSWFCYSANLCFISLQTYASGPNPGTFNTALIESTNGGISWDVDQIGSSANGIIPDAGFTSAWCTSNVDCYVSGLYNMAYPSSTNNNSDIGARTQIIIASTTNAGVTWNLNLSQQLLTSMPFTPSSVYCFASSCYASGTASPPVRIYSLGIYKFDPTTDQWVSFAPFTIEPNFEGGTTMSCASASDCLVYDQNGTSLFANYLPR